MVLIIGAGPAGTSCAISLLKAGREVTLIDRQEFPRHAPGETLHPGIEPLLKQLDVLAEVEKSGFTRHDGILNIRHQAAHFEPYHTTENWQGFQLYRQNFDQILLEKTVSLGGKFFGNTPIRNVEFEDDRIVSVQTSAGDFQPDFVIDATGRNGFLARKAGIKFHRDSPQLTAWYGYVRPENAMENHLKNPQMLWDENGWTWIAKIKPYLIAWNRLNLKPGKLPSTWLPDSLNHCQAVGKMKAADVTWRKAERVSGSNYFLAGDAAFILDPASSHGVLKALMSGIMVGFLLQKVRQRESTWEQTRKMYETWTNDWYRRDVAKLRELYNQHGLHLGPETNFSGAKKAAVF